MLLAEMVGTAREAKGFSLQEAANMLGITKAHLSDLEHGKTKNPTLRVIAALVIIYGLRPEAIIATVTDTDP